MGLLSDPEAGGGTWTRVLVRVERWACALAWLLALAWLVALAHPATNNATYFSENALLPGLVRSDFTDERFARKIYTELLEELEDKYSQRDKMPVPWLVGKMSQLHLEVYTHNFTLHYPLGRKQAYHGTNVYGILRAPRTSSLEALVVSVPYRPLSSHHKGTAAGLALMLAFAHLARPQKYWAKDIIFVVTEHEQLGMQAWLEAYHGAVGAAGSVRRWGEDGGGDRGRCLDAGELPARSGAIQAAINLEIHTPNIKYVEVKVEGLNGQLPNLDLVNLVNKMCVKSHLHHSFKNSYSWVTLRNDGARFLSGLRTLIQQITTQLTGVPNGNHGLFHRYGIEAVTLEGRDADDAAPAPHDASLPAANFYRLGAALEGTLRSLNNLLERFHQSYFFYLLPHTDRFISIGQYMPCLCLGCGALLVRALALWISLQRDEDEEEGSGEQAADTRRDLPQKEKKVKDVNKMERNEERWSVLALGADYLAVHIAGYLVMSSPVWLTNAGAEYYDAHTEQSAYWGVAALCAALAVTCGAVRPAAARGELLAPALIELATLGLAVGMHNFALGLTLVALYTPLALLVTPTRRPGKLGWALHKCKQAACLALHPLVVLTGSLALYSVQLFPEESVAASLGRGVVAAQQALLFSIVDSMIYGNWLWNVVCLLLLPVWSIFWQTLCAATVDG